VEKADVEFDVVFLDGFSPDVNPELWTYDFIRTIKNSMSSMGILVTYSSAFPVRGALIRAGFSAGTSMPFGRKRGGTAAALAGELIENPLSAKELNIITRSTAGTAYRDPSLAGDRERIMKRRKMLVKRLRLAGIPKWFK
jgi:hypothetical protein